MMVMMLVVEVGWVCLQGRTRVVRAPYRYQQLARIVPTAGIMRGD